MDHLQSLDALTADLPDSRGIKVSAAELHLF